MMLRARAHKTGSKSYDTNHMSYLSLRKGEETRLKDEDKDLLGPQKACNRPETNRTNGGLDDVNMKPTSHQRIILLLLGPFLGSEAGTIYPTCLLLGGPETFWRRALQYCTRPNLMLSSGIGLVFHHQVGK